MTENKQYYYVYKLFNPDCEGFYIGSTTDMKNRVNCHKKRCNNKNAYGHNIKLYKYIRSNGGYDSWQYEILEHVRNSINTKELHGVERKYIDQLHPSLNIQKPNRTQTEYYQDNIEAIRKKQNEKHRCPCGGKYTTAHKAIHFKSNKHRAFEQSN